MLTCLFVLFVCVITQNEQVVAVANDDDALESGEGAGVSAGVSAVAEHNIPKVLVQDNDFIVDSKAFLNADLDNLKALTSGATKERQQQIQH